jgi:putative transposase
MFAEFRDVLYTDNGRDFTSKHLEQVAADLKVRLVFSTPGVPRGRGRIERLFSTISSMLLCDLPSKTSRHSEVCRESFEAPIRARGQRKRYSSGLVSVKLASGM